MDHKDEKDGEVVPFFFCIRQGIKGLLARDSPEGPFYVLIYSLLSTVQIYI